MILYTLAQSQFPYFNGPEALLAIFWFFCLLLILPMLVHSIYYLFKKRKERGSFGRILWPILLLLNLGDFWWPVMGWIYLIFVIILPRLKARHRNRHTDALQNNDIDSGKNVPDENNDFPSAT